MLCKGLSNKISFMKTIVSLCCFSAMFMSKDKINAISMKNTKMIMCFVHVFELLTFFENTVQTGNLYFTELFGKGSVVRRNCWNLWEDLKESSKKRRILERNADYSSVLEWSTWPALMPPFWYLNDYTFDFFALLFFGCTHCVVVKRFCPLHPFPCWQKRQNWTDNYLLKIKQGVKHTKKFTIYQNLCKHTCLYFPHLSVWD